MGKRLKNYIFLNKPQISNNFSSRIADKRIQTETIHSMTVLRMAKVQRKDSGKYCVKISNKYGETELTIKVTVLGKLISFEKNNPDTKNYKKL